MFICFDRDALAQLIYDELFHWIMSRISYAYQCPNHNTSIALIDFYGFEVSKDFL